MLQLQPIKRFHKPAVIVFLLACNLLFIPLANASVITFKKDADGITCRLDKGLMKIKICRPDIIEVKYTIFGDFQHKPSLVVDNKWPNQINFTVSANAKGISITTSLLKLLIDKATNAITYMDKAGAVITSVMSWLSLPMISLGVAAGANRPYHRSTSKSG